MMERKTDGGPVTDLIQNTFMAMYARKELHEISVKEICAEVGIARTTFYSLLCIRTPTSIYPISPASVDVSPFFCYSLNDT